MNGTKRLKPQPIELDYPEIPNNAWETIHTGCACGVEIMAANHPGIIQGAVLAHNQTRVHRAWRERHGL